MSEAIKAARMFGSASFLLAASIVISRMLDLVTLLRRCCCTNLATASWHCATA
jgi:hypothetical protein